MPLTGASDIRDKRAHNWSTLHKSNVRTGRNDTPQPIAANASAYGSDSPRGSLNKTTEQDIFELTLGFFIKKNLISCQCGSISDMACSMPVEFVENHTAVQHCWEAGRAGPHLSCRGMKDSCFQIARHHSLAGIVTDSRHWYSLSAEERHVSLRHTWVSLKWARI
jgi:hypothetical protein